MVFFPDNAPRGNRVQQLVDSMANMQTDIKHNADVMDQKNIAIRPKIDTLLKQNNMDSIDDLIQKAMAQMTPDQRQQWEALVAEAQKSKSAYDWTYFAAGLLMLPEGFVLSGKLVLAIGKFVLKTAAVQRLASFFQVADGGAAAVAPAAEVGEGIAKDAAEAEAAIKDAGEIGDGVEEVVEAASVLEKLGTCLKVLGAVGFVITIFVGVLEAVEGAEQKTRLVDGIHSCQVSRLIIAYFKREATNINQQLELMDTWLDASVGDDADPEVAAYLAKKIVKNIQTEDAQIDWNELESELETQDKSSPNYYGSDDLSSADVVAQATAKNAV